MPIQISQINQNNYHFSSPKKTVFKRDERPLPAQKQDSFELSVGYINDLHGQINNMLRIMSGIKGDLILSGGDITIGDEKNKKVNTAVVKFMNLINVKGSALGNHELDTMQGDLIDTLDRFSGDYFAVNIKKEPVENQDSETVTKYNRADIEGSVKTSKIINVKGEKIGLIGAAPLDLLSRVTHPSYHTDCTVKNLEDSAEIIQKEVDDLREKGVNKIFLLSHMGYDNDKSIAKMTSGIDVIIGGHTHELIKDIKEGENLIPSSTGEPVIITEAGKNGAYFGLLNLTFDKNGVITRAQNNVTKSELYHKNLINQYMIDEILGKPEVIGYIKDVLPAPATLLEENPHANFACDAMRYEMDCDIAMWNNSGTRSFFKKGIIDSRDIKDIAPFEDRIAIADVSEKKLVNMLKHAIEDTYRNSGHQPGLIAVSGLTYTVDTVNGTLAAMSFVDKNGVEHPIDIENPRDDKFYKVVQDTFMMYNGADLDVLAPEEECDLYDFNKDFLICEYIKHLNKPVEINQSGRIRFI